MTVHSLIGVDLGSATVKVVELERAEGRILLRRCAIEAAEHTNSAESLKQFLQQVGITTQDVALGVASPEVVVKPFEFPSLPKKELMKALQLEAEQAILNGHAVSQMAIDWHFFPAAGKENIRGLLSVVPNTVVNSRLQRAKAAGLQPKVVDVEGLALWNAYWVLEASHDATPKTVFLLNVGAKTSNLMIAKGPDALILVRDIQLGGQALAKGLEKDWLSEVRDSLGYARSKGLRVLDEVLVSGGGISKGLAGLIAPVVNAPVKLWNPLDHLQRSAHSPSVDASIGPLLAVAVGLALRPPS